RPPGPPVPSRNDAPFCRFAAGARDLRRRRSVDARTVGIVRGAIRSLEPRLDLKPLPRRNCRLLHGTSSPWANLGPRYLVQFRWLLRPWPHALLAEVIGSRAGNPPPALAQHRT